MEYFQRVTPESVGISSAGILKFLDRVQRKGIELHSMMIVRHDKCAAAGWWEPYGPDYLHPLYSFSKTLTATAIGFARQEGLLSLDDRLVDLFPEACPENPSENLKKVTIHHLLCMGCGHETEIEFGWNSENWISDFLAHPFVYEPGTFYQYNTPGTNMLAAIIRRKTGLNVTEYLRPRLLDPLGIQNIWCLQLPDKDQVEMGGSGMHLATEDMARFISFMIHRGNWEGKQLLEESWFDIATVKQIETEGDAAGHIKDWAQGYGYQCWMCMLPQSYRADGAYGQFGLVFPTLDLFVIMTTGTEQTQTLMDILNEELIPAVSEAELPESEQAQVLAHVLEHLRLPALHGDRNPDLVSRIEHKVYWAETESDGPCGSMEMLVGGAGRFIFETVPIEKMWFTFGADSVTWNVHEGGRDKAITASLEGTYVLSVNDGKTYAATARFRSLNAIEMEIRRVDAISGVRMIFRFEKDELHIEAEDTLISVGGLGILPRKTCPFVCAD